MKLLDQFRANASNFLYIFIADDAAPLFNTPRGRVIYRKRQAQIRYIIHAAQSSSLTYDQIKQAIADQIIADYGRTPGQILADINQGKNCYSKNKISTPRGAKSTGITGIGATTEGGDVDGQHFISDTVTGVTVPASSASKLQPITVHNPATGQIIGNYDANTGTQLNYYDASSGTYRIGAQTTGIETRNLWANNINWTAIITIIIDFIGRLFGITSAKNIASYQSDGWYSTVDTTARATSTSVVTIAALAVAGYMLVASEPKKSKHKH